ncbi:MAG: phage portal protein [Acutalibacteraceae bacterium]
MGFFSRIFGLEERAAEPPLTKREETSAGEILTAFMPETVITRSKALKIPTVEACLSLIKGAVRGIPIKLYEYGEKGEIIEVKGDRRTYLLNTDPGDTMNASQFWDAMIDDYFLDGSARAYINGAGNIKSLHHIATEHISVNTNADPIFKDYDVYIDGNTYYPFNFLTLLRDTRDGAQGVGIIEKNSLILEVAYNSLKFENDLVAKGGNKKGFLKSVKQLSKDAIASLKNAWRRLYSTNEESVIILNGGVEFQEASATSVELQLNENKQSNSQEIIKMFNIPPGMLAGASTAQTSEDDKVKFADYCVIPLLQTIKNALNRDILYEDEKGKRFFDYDTTELKKGSLLDRMKAYDLAVKNNIYLPDECRKMENKPELGIDNINLSLGNVLYNPETKCGFVPNTGETFDMSKFFGKGGKKDEN